MRVYAREVELGLEAQNHAAEIKLRAQRRAGEILAKMDLRERREDNLKQNSSRSQRATSSASLEEIGVTKSDSSRWQQGESPGVRSY